MYFNGGYYMDKIIQKCTFFGHSNAPEEIEESLMHILIDLIENKNVTKFYVGNHGHFDYIDRKCLTELKKRYCIDFTVVLAYLPVKKYEIENMSAINTLFPDGIEKVPKRFAICYRNNWMIDNSQYVITYVNRAIGGAVKFKEIAEKKNKIVININY